MEVASCISRVRRARREGGPTLVPASSEAIEQVRTGAVETEARGVVGGWTSHSLLDWLDRVVARCPHSSVVMRAKGHRLPGQAADPTAHTSLVDWVSPADRPPGPAAAYQVELAMGFFGIRMAVFSAPSL